MKRSIAKKLQPMTVLYGLKFEAATALITESDPGIEVGHGWFQLHFGNSAKLGEFLLVLTMSDSFLLSTKPQPDAVIRKRRKRIDWVFAIEILPEDFLSGPTGCTFLSYGGSSVIYGRDHSNREFLSVVMPARNLHLLFRDPDSYMTQAWNPRRAVVLSDAMVIDPSLRGLTAETTGDAELDAMLESIG